MQPDPPMEARNYWSGTVVNADVETLVGDRRCDVVIVGGGFTGLWTAYWLKKLAPTLDVVVLESNRVAHGASGRNGGFATTLLDLSHRDLVRNFGVERATIAHHAIVSSIEAIGSWSEEHGVDIEYEATGLLTVATNAQTRKWLEADSRACDELGARSEFLEAEQVRQLLDSPTYTCGLREEAGALLNPAKLTRGLADVVRRLGVTVYENSPAASVEPATTSIVETPKGRVLATDVVLAANAYTAQLGVLKRAIVPMYSYILVTDPLTDAQWESIGWAGREGLEDKRHFIHYYRPTADGRILWGGHDTTYHWRSGVDARFDVNSQIFRESAAFFFKTFPQLRGIEFSHKWGGPIAVSTDFLPMFGSIGGSNVHYGLGYSGHGVAASHTGGQILADLVLDRQTERTQLLFVKPAKSAFPPEPFRWVGFAATRQSLKRQNRQMDAGATGKYDEPAVLRLLRRLGGPR
jgi:glycine/D-amino acid oxidase-like deaminating enzyme